jgi:phosphoribosylglycinamide formyltransferase-1
MNIAVFASGRGSNFQAILDAIDSGLLAARICLLISNNSKAGALEIARDRGIPAIHISHAMFTSEDDFAESLLKTLNGHHTELIALAGYMKKMPDSVIRHYRNRILNIHPALLPSFGGKGMYGRHVHEAVIASGQKISGATVHLVNEEYDRGPVIMQKKIEVDAGDTAESLAVKVLKVEHEIYPLALKAFIEGRVKVEGEKAWIM